MMEGCPSGACRARDKWILDAVASGRYAATFSEVISTHGGDEARFYVFSDALKVDGVRVNVSAELQQQVADLIGCLLLTPRVADLIWAQREVTVQPHPRQITSDTAAMVDHSQKIDAELARMSGSPAGKLICTVGKHWVIDNDLLLHKGRAENYGWHFDGPNFQGIKGEVTATGLLDNDGVPVRLIQGRGWAHDMREVDYSQTCVLWSSTCLLNGRRAPVEALLKDPRLAPLASHSGAMDIVRQPGVAPLQAAIVLEPDLPDAEALQQ